MSDGMQLTGLSAFGEDRGTLWPASASGKDALNLRASSGREWNRRIYDAAGVRPIVWYVDDEQINRTWFREHHREHFAVVTFSARKHVAWAIQNRMPCDAVVSDIFFPRKEPISDDEAEALRSIYTDIEKAPASRAGLKEVWSDHKGRWVLDGFGIAQDFAAARERSKQKIPVFLFSRKALLLLTIEDFLGDSPAIEGTFWLIEKPDPTLDSDLSDRAARIQRSRIDAVLKIHQQTAPWWQKILSRVSISIGPLRYKLTDVGRNS